MQRKESNPQTTGPAPGASTATTVQVAGSGASRLLDADGWPDPLPAAQTGEEQNRRDKHMREQIATIQGAARATDNHGASNPKTSGHAPQEIK